MAQALENTVPLVVWCSFHSSAIEDVTTLIVVGLVEPDSAARNTCANCSD